MAESTTKHTPRLTVITHVLDRYGASASTATIRHAVLRGLSPRIRRPDLYVRAALRAHRRKQDAAAMTREEG